VAIARDAPNALPCDVSEQRERHQPRWKVVAGYAQRVPGVARISVGRIDGMVDLGSTVADKTSQALGVSADVRLPSATRNKRVDSLKA
jgi:hypothetical protein